MVSELSSNGPEERSLWEEFGLSEPADELDGPVVNVKELKTFRQDAKSLTAETRRRIAMCIVTYKNWREALEGLEDHDD